MNWFYFSILSAVSYAIAEIISKNIADRKSDPIVLAFLSTFYASIAGFVMYCFTNEVVVMPSINVIFSLLAVGFIWAVNSILFYEALKHSDVSEFVILTKSSLVLTIIGAIIFYNERFSFQQFIAIGAILCGVIFLTYKKGGIKLHRGSKMALLSAFLSGIAILLDRKVVNYFPAMFYSGLVYSVVALFLAPVYLFNKNKSEYKPNIRTQIIIAFASVIYTFSAFFYYRSYKADGYVSLTNTITQLQIPIVVFYGIIVLREKTNIVQKILATAMMIIGAYLLK